MKKCSHCGKQIQDDAIKCRYCNNFLDSNEIKKLKGLTGWLIIVILGLLYGVTSLIITIKDYIIPQINDGTFGLLSNSYSNFYIPGYKSIFLFELIGNFGIVFFILLLIYLFFCKHELFPKLFKIYVVTNFLFILTDNIWYTLWSNEVNSYIPLLQGFIYMTIWGLYIHKSIRVKNTFIEKSYKNKNILSIILLALLGLLTISTILKIDISKFNYNEYQYGTDICISNFGGYSIYTGKVENGEFICDCQIGYEFGGADGNTCIKTK